jgi:hypothetical protein
VDRPHERPPDDSHAPRVEGRLPPGRSSADRRARPPFGSFGESVAKASTQALASGSASDDSTYTSLEGQIAGLTAQRDALAAKIRAALQAAAFDKKALNEQDAKGWIDQAQKLIDQAEALAG